MPDFMRIGGVTGWLRVAAIAGATGVPMSTHLYPEVAAHVMPGDGDRALTRMAGLGRSHLAEPLRNKGQLASHARRARHRPGMERGRGRRELGRMTGVGLLTVSDNGVGFDSAQDRGKASLGLASM